MANISITCQQGPDVRSSYSEFSFARNTRHHIEADPSPPSSPSPAAYLSIVCPLPLSRLTDGSTRKIIAIPIAREFSKKLVPSSIVRVLLLLIFPFFFSFFFPPLMYTVSWMNTERTQKDFRIESRYSLFNHQGEIYRDFHAQSSRNFGSRNLHFRRISRIAFHQVMIAGQLTRVQIGEIAVSRWWSFPYSCLTPTDYYCSSLRRILFLSSLFRLGRDRWTGQRPPGFFTFLLGGRLWEKGGIRKKEGVDVHAICLLVSPTRFEKPAGETSS